MNKISETPASIKQYLKRSSDSQKLQASIQIAVYFRENRLTEVLKNHNILDKFQSGFHHMHSTETALLRITNDTMISSDVGDCSVLVLLDVSAAFDTVDHAF